MNFFQSIRRYFAVIGVNSAHSMQRHAFVNIRSLTVFILFSIAIGSNCLYLLYVANRFEEYADCVFATCGTIMIAIGSATGIIKMESLFQLITSIETIIQKRKIVYEY